MLKIYQRLPYCLIFYFLAGAGNAFSSEVVMLTEQEQHFIQSKKSLNMCIGPDFMPYEDNINGQHVGMIADFMAIVSKNVGLPFELITTKDWEETMLFARSKKCDIISFILETPTRREFLNFTSPYIAEPYVIATSIDKPFIVNIESIKEHRLGVVRGYAFVELLREQYPDINIVEVDTVIDGLKRLDGGEIYAYLGALSVIGYNIQQLGLQNLKINGTLNTELDASIGSRKDLPIINEILNKGVNLITDVERNKIRNSWIRIQYEHQFDYTLTIQISTFVVLMFGLMLYHQNVLRKHNKVLEALSETDKLTKINNRLKLDKFLQYELDLFERYHDAFSIILIDIDHFKQFNDTFGHLIGDKVITHVAKMLKENCRKLDMVGRWGGEEFLMICPKTSMEEAKVLGETLRLTVENNHLQNIEGVTISLGVAEMTINDNFNTIIGRADKALYKAKQNGRNRIELAQQ